MIEDDSINRGDIIDDQRPAGNRRARKAAETRRRIQAAARRLFHERGYGATSLEEVADAADVAVQTIYAIYRSKRGLLFALVDDTARETEAVAHRAALEAEPDPTRQAAMIVDFAAGYFGQVHDIVEILRGAGTADVDIGGAWRFGEERRREKDRGVVGHWARLGVLRIPAARAEDVLWALTGPDVFRLLVHESGWPIDDYRAWLEEVLRRELLVTRRGARRGWAAGSPGG